MKAKLLTLLLLIIALAAAGTMFWFSLGTANAAEEKIKVLLVDGQNNHAWQQTSPVLLEILENTGKFKVDHKTARNGAKTPRKVMIPTSGPISFSMWT